MTALSDATEQARRSALAAIAKSYVANGGNPDQLAVILDGMGATDKDDQRFFFAALDVLRDKGAQAPKETTASVPPGSYSERRETEQATEAQLDLIRDLCATNGVQAPDTPLSKVDASRVITAIKAGEYDPAAWTLPVALRD